MNIILYNDNFLYFEELYIQFRKKKVSNRKKLQELF